MDSVISIEIVGWHHEDEFPDDFLEDPKFVGWSGGYAPNGVISPSGPWADYIERVADTEEDRQRLECLRAYIEANDVRNGGSWHQRGGGIPRFSDGTYIYLSQRAWGDLMAAIWGGTYCDFAWEF